MSNYVNATVNLSSRTRQVAKGGEWVEGASSRNTVPLGPERRHLVPPDCIPSPRTEEGGGMGQWRGYSPPRTLHLG